MKKLFLILLASVLITLSFISCDDEWGILGLSNTMAYILIPKKYEISSPFKKDSDTDYSYLSKFTGYDDSYFKNELEKNSSNYVVYYCMTQDYYADFETRRNFKETIEFEITGIIDAKEISEIVNFDIEIPYLKQGNNCCEFQIQTENFGIINLLYRYYFSRYI